MPFIICIPNRNLSTITRGGYLDLAHSDEKKYNQIYGFEYDKFGNRTKVTLKGEVVNKSSGAVESTSGTSTLATYTYQANNGPLTSMTYGPSTGTKVTYTYDAQERVKSVKYSDTNTTYGYNYSADGSLAGITVNGTPAYEYTYDSLGRLIYSAKLQNQRPVLYTSHQYDTSNRLIEQNWQIGSDSFSESYTYNENDGTLSSMTSGGDALGFAYNNLKQLSERTSPKLDMTYTYRTWTDAQNKQWQTNQVASVQYLKHGTKTQLLPMLNYSYDAVGNIAQIKENNTNAAEYTYDNQNQVTQEKIPSVQTSDYTYDTYGNIRSKKTTYHNGTYEQYTYTYGNAAWKDQLTKIVYRNADGTSKTGTFTYDAVGNPLTYNNGKKNWTFTWKHGRQLATATDGTTTITNTYDVDGIRDSKTVGNVKHTYTTLGGKIVREAYGTYTIDYFYDNDSRPYKMVVKNGTSTVCTGYFVLNLQGDVIAIIDSEGTVAVKYQYDAWGREIGRTKSGDYAENLYKYNALKYRGYYYDADLGLYYLNSRFYDAEIGRYINADGAYDTNQGVLGYDMYTYCLNNSVNMHDPTGKCGKFLGFLWKIDCKQASCPNSKNYIKPKAIKPISSYNKGKGYVYVIKEEELDVMKEKEDNVVVVVDKRNELDPDMQVQDSWKVTQSKQQKEISQIMLDYNVDNPVVPAWSRTVNSMVEEWKIHNFAYNLGYKQKRTGDCDFNNADEGMGFWDFVGR